MENCKSVEELKKEISEYDSFVADTVCDLEKVNFILNNLLNEYDWRYEPTAEKALKAGNTVGGGTDEENFSYKWLGEYKDIMQFINIANDYCHKSFERSNKIYQDGIINE